MQDTLGDAALLHMLASTHHRLLQRARATAARSPEAVLDLGAAVLLHGALERALPLNPLIDADAQAGFTLEHARLAEDLHLLEGLREADPDSEDVTILSQALLERLREHLSRDDRLFYREPNASA